MKEPYKVLNSKMVYQGRVFDLVEEEILLESGRQTRFARVVHPGAVVIIPRLGARTLLLIRQYRHAVGKTILEFPAGTLDAGEDPLTCARREIAEETGHIAARWQQLGTIYPAPGFCSETQHLFLADDLAPEQSKLDEDEIISVVRMSVGEVEEAIRRGDMCDGKSISIYARARLLGLL